jgi:phosphoserine phosphatase
MMNDAQRQAPETLVFQEPPLCVDLDGTMIRGDTLIFSLRRLLRTKPWVMAALILSLLRGKAAFKRAVADRFIPDPACLSYRQGVMDFLAAEHARGRCLILATAADDRIARAVAAHLGIFATVIGSDGTANRRGREKLDALRERLSGVAFDYMGDSTADLPIFAQARTAFLVAPSRALLKAARKRCARVEVVP